MIATDNLVFLHLHKSGGSFVNECLIRHLPSARHIGYHLPRALVPAGLGHLPLLGMVRSPWSYYVSWYSFQRGLPNPNWLFRTLSEDGRLGFEATVRNMLSLSVDEALLRTAASGLPSAYLNRGLNLPGFALLGIKDTGLGFYSFLERHIHGPDDGRLFIGRMERLREELPQMLEAAGQRVNAGMARFIASAPRRNASSHAPYAEHYDTALRDLVAERDAALIARMGYSFGD